MFNCSPYKSCNPLNKYGKLANLLVSPCYDTLMQGWQDISNSGSRLLCHICFKVFCIPETVIKHISNNAKIFLFWASIGRIKSQVCGTFWRSSSTARIANLSLWCPRHLGKRKYYQEWCSDGLARKQNLTQIKRHHQPSGPPKPRNEAVQSLRETAGLWPAILFHFS